MKYETQVGAWLKEPKHRALLALIAATCLWFLLEPTLFGAAVSSVQFFHVFAWGTLTTVMYFAALLLLLHGKGFIARALSLPIWRRVATLGYGVYLVHIPICDHVVVPAAHYCQTKQIPMLIVWPTSLVFLTVASLAIGYLMHILIEKPSLKLRQWLAA